MRAIGFEQQVAHLLGIGVQRERQHQRRDALRAVAHRHVAQVLRDQLRVRHDHGRAVAELDLGRAHVDAANVAFDARDADHVAHLHRALGQQDQPRHEVLHDLLQAETDTHRQRTDDPREVVPPNAEQPERHQHEQHVADVGEQRDQRHAHPGIHAERGHELAVEPAAQRAQQVEADREPDHGVHDPVGHDVQALQPLAADHRDRTVHQVARRRAEAARQQRDGRDQHQQARAEAGQDRAGLVEVTILEREQVLDLLARRQARREQAFARVTRQLDQDVGGAQHDLEPHEP